MAKTYNVYKLYAYARCYRGSMYIAADTVEEAYQILQEFVERDKDNAAESFAVRDCTVKDFELMDELRGTRKGIIENDLSYTG